MLPALFGVSVSQINLLLDSVLASFLETGSISGFNYADRFPAALGAFGNRHRYVILFCRRCSRQARWRRPPRHCSRTLDWAIRMGHVGGCAAALAAVLLAEP